jgi:hypothetical protein
MAQHEAMSRTPPTRTPGGIYTARVTLEDSENSVNDSDDVPITVTAQQP